MAPSYLRVRGMPWMRLKSFFRHDLLRGSALVAGTRVGTMICGLGVNMLLARLLPIDMLGAYFLIASVTQVGGLIAMGGTSQSAIPLLASAEGDGIRPALRGVGLYAALAIAFSGALVFLFYGHIAGAIGITETGTGTAALVALWLVARATAQAIAHMLRAFGRMALFGLLETFLFNVMLFVVLLLYASLGARPNLNEVVIAAAVIATIGVPIALVPLLKEAARLPRSAGVALREAITVSLPLWVMVVANTALADAHLWVSGALGSPESAALFGVALRVARLLGLPLLAVNMAIGPRIAQLWKQGKKRELEKMLRLSATGISVVSLSVAGALLLAGPATMTLLFGPAFEAAWPAFLILLAGQVLNTSTGSPMILMTVSASQRPAMFFSLVAGAIGLGISLLLGRSSPTNGVAIGSATTVVLVNIFAVAYCRFQLGIVTLPQFWPRQTRD